MEEGRSAGLAQIRRWADKGTLPHALILSGGTMPEDARFAAAAWQCRSETLRPCGKCRDCRKVFADIHPDVITAEDTEHKNLSVDVIRRLCADVYIRPNEGRRKVYVFPDCARLTEADQNVLLKLVEDGPPYAAFLFCTENPEVLLKTVRSRCVHLALGPPQAAQAQIPEAETLCQVLLRRDKLALAALTVDLELRKLSRDRLRELLEQTREHLALSLRRCVSAAGREKRGALSPGQIASAMETLRQCRRACEYNVGSGHVLGKLTVEWEAMM